MSDPTVNPVPCRCGAERVWKYQQWFCRPCALARMQKRRNIGRGFARMDLSGARERLSRTIFLLPSDVLIERVAGLLRGEFV
jgi:hypothetical protein